MVITIRSISLANVEELSEVHLVGFVVLKSVHRCQWQAIVVVPRVQRLFYAIRIASDSLELLCLLNV